MRGVEEIMRQMKAGQPVIITTGKVDSVDTTAMTCLVKIAGKPDRIDVRLRSVITDDSGLTVVPETDSDVLVALIDNKPESTLLLATSRVEQVLYKTDDSEWLMNNDGLTAVVDKTELEASKDGYILKRQNETLKGLLDELIDAINQITVPTATGPSGVPVNKPVFTQIKNRLNTLFKG